MGEYDGERRLSVICLTYARRWAAEWQKALWASYPVDLVVVDGSPNIDPGSSSGAEEACRWQLLDMPGASYFERLREAADAVETRHAVIIDDEEAYLYSGLASASERLDRDWMASCAGGSAAYMRSVNGQIMLRPFSGRIADWSTPFALDQPAPEARIEEMLSTYRTPNIFYSVFRSGFLKDFVAAGVLPEINGTVLGFEYLWTATLAATGTYSMEAYPFLLRMGGSQPGAIRLRDRLTDSEIRAIAKRVVDVAGHSMGSTGDSSGMVDSLQKGIRAFEQNVFGPERPSPEEMRRRSQDPGYLNSFISPEAYLAGFGRQLPPAFARELLSIVELAKSSIRPAESLVDAMS